MSGLRLGISACLLGQEVRFDGGHKRDRFLTDQLGQYVDWVPVCPEVEVGMGTPREALHLVRDGQTLHPTGYLPSFVESLIQKKLLELRFLYNPTEYTVTKGSTWSRPQTSGAKSTTRPQFGGTNPQTLQMEIFLVSAM